MSEIEKIKEYLLSDDIEMVQLGVSLLAEKIPQEQWSSILEKSQVKTIDDVGWSTRKWDYVIIENRVQITQPPLNGLYSKLNSNYKHIYNLDTFTLESVKEAVGKFYIDKYGTKNAKRNP